VPSCRCAVVADVSPYPEPMALDAGAPSRRTWGSPAAIVAILLAVGLIAAAALITHHQHTHRVSASDRGSLTPAQYRTALTVARHEIARETENAGGNKPAVTQAVATVVPGNVKQTNLAGTCTSGQLVVVDLVGQFPGIAVGGGPTSGPEAAPTGPDEWVVVKADEHSGDACLMGVSLGRFSVPSGAADLTPAL
jgi:hypothetical protein